MACRLTELHRQCYCHKYKFKHKFIFTHINEWIIKRKFSHHLVSSLINQLPENLGTAIATFHLTFNVDQEPRIGLTEHFWFSRLPCLWYWGFLEFLSSKAQVEKSGLTSKIWHSCHYWQEAIVCMDLFLRLPEQPHNITLSFSRVSDPIKRKAETLVIFFLLSSYKDFGKCMFLWSIDITWYHVYSIIILK